MQSANSTVPLHKLASHNQSRSATRPMVQELRVAFQTVAYQTDELHRHDYFEVYVFNKGTGACVADDVTFQVSSRTVFVLPPGTMHYWKHSENIQGFIIRIPLIEGHMLFGNTMNCPESFPVQVQTLPHLVSLLTWMASDSPSQVSRRTPLSRQRWRLLFECLSDEAEKCSESFSVSGPSDVCASFRALLERKFHLRLSLIHI